MKKENSVVVQDMTPVSGEGMAHQNYIDLTLDKNDLVEAIIAEHQIPIQEKIDAISLKQEAINDRRREIKELSKVWIICEFNAKFGDRITKIKALFETEGTVSFDEEHTWDASYYDSMTIRFKKDDADASLSYELKNSLDFPHYNELENLYKAYKDFRHESDKLSTELRRVTGNSKKVKLEIAKQILGKTEQGKELLAATSIGRIAGKVKRETKKADK